MSTGTNIERITENNTIIDNNNDDLIAFKNRINNLPDTSTATATAKDIVLGKTAFANGQLVEGTCTWQDIEWTPQPDWWDIKKIVEEDEEDYPYKIIALHDEGAKRTYWQWVQSNTDRLKKIKFSDGQEITSAQTVTIADNGFKNCAKGYKTCYSIWYFSGIPNFYNRDFGGMFKCSLYIYFYNIDSFFAYSNSYWVTSDNCRLEAIENNTTISTGNNNFPLMITSATQLHKLPNYIWNRLDNPAPAFVSIVNAPFLDYNNFLNIIQNRGFNFGSGQMPNLNGTFWGKTIDFEKDWGLDTTLFTRTNNIYGPYAIQKIDFTNVTSSAGTIRVTEIYEIYNIKITNSWFLSFLFSYATLIRVLNALYDYSESTETHTLTLGSGNLSRLTDEDKAIATRKRLDFGIEYIL